MTRRLVWLLLLTLTLVATPLAQELTQRPATALPLRPAAMQDANTDPAYKALRSIGTGEILPANNLVLQRDAGIFTLNGVLSFLAPVNGKVTGPVLYSSEKMKRCPCPRFGVLIGEERHFLRRQVKLGKPMWVNGK